MSKKTTIWVAIGLLGIVTVIGFKLLSTCEERECYFPKDSPLQDEVYAEPDDLVERFFSNPDAHGIGGERVKISETSEGVTVIIEMYNVPDDSIRDVRYRFDLREVSGYWEIEWSGIQQHCGRGAIGPQVWHNHYCN